jgi:hypothetical protein
MFDELSETASTLPFCGFRGMKGTKQAMTANNIAKHGLSQAVHERLY